MLCATLARSAPPRSSVRPSAQSRVARPAPRAAASRLRSGSAVGTRLGRCSSSSSAGSMKARVATASMPVYQGDYFEALAKLRTAHRARRAPTLTHVVGEVLPYLAEAGVLEPLEEFEGEAARSRPRARPGGQLRGRRYAAARRAAVQPLDAHRVYNGKLFDELGLAPPTTWDELRDVARKATVRGRRHDAMRLRVPDRLVVLGRAGRPGGRQRRRGRRRALARRRGGRARAPLLADARHVDRIDEASARPRLQRVAGRQHRFPRRPRGDDLDLAPRSSATSRRTRNSRSAPRLFPRDVRARGADGGHPLRDAHAAPGGRAGGRAWRSCAG